MHLSSRLLTLSLSLAAASSLAAADYFVSPQGNDGNSGTAATKPFKTIAKAAGLAQAGDVIHLAAGTYEEHVTLKSSGRENAPITFRGAGADKVVWTTAEPDPEAWLAKYALNLTNVEQVVVEGITFRDCAAWIMIDQGRNIIVRNCIFDGGRIYNLLRINNGSYNRILNCKFLRGTKETGFRKDLEWAPDPGADYIEIFRDSHHNLVQDCFFGPITHVAVAIMPHEKGKCPRYNIVRNNVFTEPRWKPMGVHESEYTLVENNVCSGTGGLFVQFESPLVIMRRNLFLRFRDVSDAKPDITLRGAIRIQAGSSRNRIYHNLFYGNQRTITNNSWGTVVTDNLWKNNIFFDNGQTVFFGFKDYATKNRQSFLNNLMRGKAPGEKLIKLDKDEFTLAEAQAKLPELYAGNLEADPRFANPEKDNFQLQAGSPAIDAGAHLTFVEGAGEGATITVNDPLYFCDGFGLIPGDLVQVGANPPVRILKVDYAQRMLTLEKKIAFKDQDPVSQPYAGKAPDLGPFEFTSK